MRSTIFRVALTILLAHGRTVKRGEALVSPSVSRLRRWIGVSSSYWQYSRRQRGLDQPHQPPSATRLALKVSYCGNYRLGPGEVWSRLLN